MITGVVVYVGFEVWSTLVMGPLGKAVSDIGSLPQEDEEEGSIFIPFPGTTKQMQPKPYRGSDPEWQEFLKFSADKALAQRTRGGL